MDFETNHLWLMLLAAALLLAGSLWHARRAGPMWLLSPRGLFAIVLLANGCGIPAYRLLFGKYPPLFGLEERYVVDASWLLLSVQAGVLVSTFLPTRWVSTRLAERMTLAPNEAQSLIRVSIIAILLTGVPRYVQLAQMGVDAVLGAQYGSGQWDSDSAQTWVNLSFISVPTLLALNILWAASGRSFRSIRLATVTAYALIPPILGAGRRDILLVVFSWVFAIALRIRRLSLRFLLTSIVALVALSWGIAASRAGGTLAFQDRVNAVQVSETDSEALAGHLLTLHAGTSVLSAAMSVFPVQHPFTLGSTYGEAAVNALTPRFLFGFTAFPGATTQFHDLYYPSVTSIGLDYSLAAEAYQNFGLVGPFVAALALGYLLTLTFVLANPRSRRPTPWLMVHFHLLTSAIWALRTDAHTTTKLMVYGSAWILLLAFVVRARVRSRSLGPVPSRRTPTTPTKHQSLAADRAPTLARD